MYITYPNYTELGGSATETAFPTLELMAEKKLDYWTQNRIKPEEITPEIRLVMKMLIDHLNEKENGEQDISSVSNDGVSISFADAKTSEQKLSGIYGRAVEILPAELVSVCV